jgi:TPR repeat protein
MKTYSWKEAFEDAHEAARRGSPSSQNFVGYYYDIGRGVRQDSKMARRWYGRAARNLSCRGGFRNLGIHPKQRGNALGICEEAALNPALQPGGSPC